MHNVSEMDYFTARQVSSEYYQSSELPQWMIAELGSIEVGAAKSGTTSLFHHLNQHPDIFIPPRKECRFFSQMPGNCIGGEAAAFQNVADQTKAIC